MVSEQCEQFSKKRFFLFWFGSEQRIQTENHFLNFPLLNQYADDETVRMYAGGTKGGICS